MRIFPQPLLRALEKADRRRYADLRALFGWTQPDATDAGPCVLAHFDVLRKIGSGTGGAVFLARDRHSKDYVAIKVLRPGADSESQSRFRREASCGLIVNHPNVVASRKILRHQELDFIVMEYVRGKTLSRVIRPRGLPVSVCRDYAHQMASAVGALHARKMLHRDIKPANFVVNKRGIVKLLDLGLAKLLEDDGATSCHLANAALFETQQGTILGTVGYMAPEQVRGQAADQRSDVFSLGAVFYEMLSGRRAFEEATPIETMNAILHKTPLPLPAHVPAPLAAIVRRCLQKNPARRYRTANDLADALAALTHSGRGPGDGRCGVEHS
jgi:serine/threonine protein kinase